MSLKLAVMGVFTPGEWAKATEQGIFFSKSWLITDLTLASEWQCKI